MASSIEEQSPTRRAFLFSDVAAIVASLRLSYRLLPYHRPCPQSGVVHLEPFGERAWTLLVILSLWSILYICRQPAPGRFSRRSQRP
jgi:hypothetical protein